MNLKTLNDYREMAHAERYFGNNEISLDIFFEVLAKAEDLKRENELLYGKLNIINDVLRDTRSEIGGDDE